MVGWEKLLGGVCVCMFRGEMRGEGGVWFGLVPDELSILVYGASDVGIV